MTNHFKADHYFDLENPRDLARLDHAQTALESLNGLVVIDEVQLRPDLFPLHPADPGERNTGREFDVSIQ